MDPVTVAAISGIAGATKTAVETVRLVLEKAKGRDAEKAAQEALSLVSDLQTRIFQLQEVAFRLHGELAESKENNLALRAEIRQKEEWAAERKKYKTKKVGHSLLLVSEDEGDDVYFCPTCFRTKQTPITVQPYAPKWGSIGNIAGYRCQSCGAQFPTNSTSPMLNP